MPTMSTGIELNNFYNVAPKQCETTNLIIMSFRKNCTCL